MVEAPNAVAFSLAWLTIVRVQGVDLAEGGRWCWSPGRSSPTGRAVVRLLLAR